MGRARNEPWQAPNDVAERTMFTPDDVFDNLDQWLDSPPSKVIVVDDDYYYLASVLAEWLASRRVEVEYVTSATCVAPFPEHTLEQVNFYIIVCLLFFRLLCV